MNPDGEPEKPEYIATNDDANELWESVVQNFAKQGIATNMDWAELACLCEWWARYRKLSRYLDDLDVTSDKFYSTQILTGQAWKNFSTIASKFGMSPADRAKLGPIGKKDTPSESLADFAKKKA